MEQDYPYKHYNGATLDEKGILIIGFQYLVIFSYHIVFIIKKNLLASASNQGSFPSSLILDCKAGKFTMHRALTDK
ncbi:hypothetical protein FRC02_004655, partial [Tulasnella sp. 418]